MKNKYVLISPCRNESKYMRQTLDTVIAQSVRPTLWVIVDDGSTDETPHILLEYAKKHAWIKVVTRKDRGKRSVGPGVIEAFNEGYAAINPDEFKYLCKLDLDLRMPPKYFEIIMQRMDENPRIATASGKAYIETDHGLESERHGDENSLGMVKFYRVDCFKEMGGFVQQVMWDGIDGHLCRMHGWMAMSWEDPELRFVHLRPMGSSQQSIFTGRMRHGFGQYFMGSSFLWMLLTFVYRVPEKPYVIGGFFIVLGWLKAWIKGEDRYQNTAFRKFLSDYQWRAMFIGKKKAIEEIHEKYASKSIL
ncbi:glycosyltransferase family A protein [Methylophilus aquaticus]|uniref:Glycosyltransferase family A protein n=1 Tax=Methylophilus aquaticus TaxID=1971610 RepID=A0ABT9JT74_9PROT|nr:glycosyltransferase family A protein [Methylophilus aquaticus]MDP8567765.1 glycosyltransferase family A protein [Methylophilus aquaticus]